MIDRLARMIGIGRVTLVKDDKDVQLFQISQGKTGSDNSESIADDVPMLGIFGLSSNPPEQSEIVLLRVGGDRSQQFAVGSNHRPSRRKNLGAGETILFNQQGAYVWMKAGSIEIDAAGRDVVVQNAANVTITASTKVRIDSPKLEVTGDVIAQAGGSEISLKGLHDAYNAHKHTGVQAGGSSTGATDHVA